MNRQMRRQLKRSADHAAEPAVVVRLVGGPMDGWLVKPDAPALKAGWGPPRDDYDYGPGPGKWGRYGDVTTGEDGILTSQWMPEDPASPAP